MPCPNDPGKGNRRQTGVCHVCAMRERLPVIFRVFAGTMGRTPQPVSYCAGCCHWFCKECWRNVMGRLTGFAEKWLRTPIPGCCGPEARNENQ